MTQKDSEVNEQNKPHSKDQPDKPQDIVKTSPEESKAGSDIATTTPAARTEPDIATMTPAAKTESDIVKAPPITPAGSDTVRIPRDQTDQKKEEAPVADNGKEKSGPDFASVDPSEAHVLVVEDNVPNFVLIARMLAYMGVQRCEWKTSGWQVVEFADTLPRIDLILMDIRLPYEDGFQALEKVRSNPRLKDTLVVAVTAEASVEQMRRAKEAGFDGFLGKPLDPDRFPDQVRRVLSGEPVWEIH
ncbi:MAG: response regulator [Anaerolineae bacterium]|nr:response regulator [Anaerolineae bacterium]